MHTFQPDIILDYPYLAMSLLGLATIAGIALLLPQRRLGLLIGGLLGTPYGLLSFEFVPDYWNPRFLLPLSIGGHFVCGLEDLLFSFVTGALAWLFLAQAANGGLSCDLRPGRLWWRFLLFGVPGVLMARLLKVLVFHDLPMIATCLTVAVMALLYLRLRPWSLALAVGTCWRFCLAYAAFMAGMLSLFPAAAAYWDTPHELPFDLLGVPAWEMGWAVAYGLVFPLFLLTVVSARWEPRTAALAGGMRDQLPDAGS